MIAFAGHLRLTAESRPDGRTILTDQAFRAPFHVSKPYWDPDTGTLLVQVVNPTAGILAGDRLESAVTVGPGGALLVTTPSASRVFRMRSGLAVCQQQFSIETGAWLEFAPEPLVPHRGARYHQATRIDVAKGGRGVWVEQLMPGRLGHGEAWAWTELELKLELRIDGTLVLRERLRQSGEELQALGRVFGAGETACFATIVLIDATSSFTPVPVWRPDVAALHRRENQVGVSALNQGVWTIRVVAEGPVQLRETLAQIRALLAASYPELRTSVRRY